MKAAYSMLHGRSDVLRTTCEQAAIDSRGERVLWLQLSRSVLTFFNSTELEDALDERLVSTLPPLELLVLDGRDLHGIDTTGMHCLEELLLRASKEGFYILLAAPSDAVVSTIVTFGIATEAMVGGEIAARANELIKAGSGHSTLVLVSDIKQLSSGLPCFVSAETIAAEFCEVFLIISQFLDDEHSCCGAPPLGHLPYSHMSLSAQQTNACRCSEAKLVEENVPASHPAMPLLVELHSMLAHHKQYAASNLLVIANTVELKRFEAGEDIYCFDPNAWPAWCAHDASCENGPAPPLVWLLSGEVVHIWQGCCLGGSSWDRMAIRHQLHPAQRIEKASTLDAQCGDSHSIVAPFATDNAFYVGMLHPGKLQATQSSLCIYMARDRFAAMPTVAQELLRCYLVRKRFLRDSIHRTIRPNLVL